MLYSDDGEYAESMKIMNEVKIDGYNGNFFKQFGYDKPCKCNNIFKTMYFN